MRKKLFTPIELNRAIRKITQTVYFRGGLIYYLLAKYSYIWSVMLKTGSLDR